MSRFFSLSASDSGLIDDNNASPITTYSSYEINKLLNSLNNNLTNCATKEYPPGVRTDYQDTFETPFSSNAIIFWVLREGVKMAPDVDYVVVDSNTIKFKRPVSPNYSVTILVIGRGATGTTPNSTPNNSSVIFTQSEESLQWNVIHNLGFKYPNVILVDSEDNKVEGNIKYIDSSNCIITFDTPCSGKCICSI